MARCAGSHKTVRDADCSVRVGIASSGGMLLDAEARRRGETRGEHVRIRFSPWNAAQDSQNLRARSQRRSYGCAARLTLGWKADNRSPRRLPQSGLVHYLELAALHKIIEEGRERFHAAVVPPRHQFP